MIGPPKKRQKVDLEKIASQLASIRILIVPGDQRHLLRAAAKFDTRSFDAGAYRVSIGLKQAILHLDLPSYDIENAYQATLPKETWSESWKHFDSSSSGAGLQARLGARIAGFLSFAGEALAKKNKSESAEQKASAPYRIVSATPSGWRMGTELGDPRDPRGTLPDGLDHCLNGEYLSGKGGERGEGMKEKDGTFALCELKPKSGANDPRVVATLFGVSGSLQIVITPSNTSVSLKFQSEKNEREEELRKAFVEICLKRAEAAVKEGARTETMLSGEFYLSHHEIRAPVTPPPKNPNLAVELTSQPRFRDITTPSKARADAKRRQP
jgi:hypothetical protein